jgi:Domain of unknown function (DUF4159)
MRDKRHLALLLAVWAVGSAAYAQRGGYYGVRRPGPDSFNGTFTFCRLAVRAANDGDGGGWGVDYPRADENLSIRLSELTKTPVNFDEAGTPHYVVVLPTEPALFQCPFVMLTNPGRAFLADEEAAALRTYLQKGGFLWSDDFWGSFGWDHWIRELRKVLPADQYPLVDIPVSHPMFHTLFDAQRIPQIPNIGFYSYTRRTSERGSDSAVPHAGAILDSNGRVSVLITHNTDFGDAYEREGDDPEFFYKFSVEGYAIGIDVLLYAMTH